MIYLTVGVMLWAIVHWFPMAMPEQRSAAIARLGDGPYKGAFALASLAAIVLIVIGWGEAPMIPSYIPPLFSNGFIVLAVAVALTLFIASQLPNNFRRWIRHPQLTGVLIWALAHLLVNGTVRDVVLFGGLAIWALLAIVLSNRRDGPWQRPAAVAVWKDFVVLAAGATASAVLFYFHGWLFGVSALH
ncbi:MAG: NnrU family protein [Pseudomonadota bacterium]